MALAFIAGAVMTVVGLVFAPAMLEIMNTTEDTIADSTLYLRIVFLSMIPSMVYNVGSSILRAIGDSRSPLYFQMCIRDRPYVVVPTIVPRP